MYENETAENILKRMLGNVPSNVDKREGSIIYDALAPTSIEAELLYALADYFLKNTFGDTADREYLIERAKERGLVPYPATYAIAKMVSEPPNITIPIGSRFSYDNVNFKVIEQIKDGEYKVECEELGSIGNVPAGKLIPIQYIAGLATAELTEILIPGDDEEDTEDFRARYLNSFNSQAYGGNIADYKEKVNALSGVGGAKIYPVWNGGGTVKVVIVTSEYKPPTDELIDKVQTELDPVRNSGEGVGIAPIGHFVTVEGAKNSAVAISLTVAVNGELENYKEQILKVIDDYFIELNKTWASTKIDTVGEISNKGLIIRTAQIESRILNIEGVQDINHTLLNGVDENLELGVDELAVRGEVEWR